MRAYRFAYGLAAVRPCTFGNALAKWDLEGGTCRLWHEAGCIPSEPLFVERPGAQGEDDGCVLAHVVGADGVPFLLVLDGGTFGEVARALLPSSAGGYQFHGHFEHHGP